MSGYKFTCDWFSIRIPEIQTSISNLDTPPLKILEIGSWEGRSACWFLQNFPGAHLTCVDTWEGSVEHSPESIVGIYDRFCHNVKVARVDDRVTAIKAPSEKALYGLTPESYDLIYVDGDHRAFAALRDIIMTWGLLRPGGVMLIDDYGAEPHDSSDYLDLPRLAVDVFVQLHEKQLQCLHQGYQVHLQKHAAPENTENTSTMVPPRS